MATNPRIPEQSPGKRNLPTLAEQRKKPASPLVPLGILVAAVLLIAILIWLPRTPKQTKSPTNAAIPTQPAGDQLQLSHTRIVPDPTGTQMYIYSTLFNAGSTAINGIRVNVILQDHSGQPINGAATVAENADGRALVANPVPPNSSRDIRINVQQVPQNWNHQMPEITIADVTSQAGR